MKRFVIAILALSFSTICFAKDITIKGVPDGITDEEVTNWVSVLIERVHTAKINQIPEFKAAQKKAQEDIDVYRKANGLKPMFEIPKEIEPKDVPQG